MVRLSRSHAYNFSDSLKFSLAKEISVKNQIMTYLLATCLALGSAACGGEQEEEPMDNRATMTQDEDLNQLRGRLISAYGSGDARTLAQLFTEDAVLIPSVGQEIKGRQAIEQTYAGLWRTWKVAHFNLTPAEGKISGDWAFERGTINLQVVPAGSLTSQPTNQQAPGQTQDQPAPGAAQPQSGQRGGGQTAGATTAGGVAPGAQAVMDTSYYVFVMQKHGGDWKISWFISTNPPEYSATVTEQAPTGTQPRQGGAASQPGTRPAR